MNEGRTYAFPEGQTLEEARPGGWSGPPAATVVAVEDGRIVGSAKMGPNRPGRGAHVATASFIVDPAHRVKGVGRALGRVRHRLEPRGGLPRDPVQRRRRGQRPGRAPVEVARVRGHRHRARGLRSPRPRARRPARDAPPALNRAARQTADRGRDRGRARPAHPLRRRVGRARGLDQAAVPGRLRRQLRPRPVGGRADRVARGRARGRRARGRRALQLGQHPGGRIDVRAGALDPGRRGALLRHRGRRPGRRAPAGLDAAGIRPGTAPLAGGLARRRRRRAPVPGRPAGPVRRRRGRRLALHRRAADPAAPADPPARAGAAGSPPLPAVRGHRRHRRLPAR